MRLQLAVVQRLPLVAGQRRVQLGLATLDADELHRGAEALAQRQQRAPLAAPQVGHPRHLRLRQRGGEPAPGARPVASDNNPIALGENVFRTAVPACVACHSIAPGVNMAGPTMAGVSARAEQTLASGDYKGEAKDVQSYIRESIVSPSAHLVPGAMYSAGGVSFMPDTYGKDLTPEQIEQLVAYLSTLR